MRLLGYSPWGRKQSDMIELLTLSHFAGAAVIGYHNWVAEKEPRSLSFHRSRGCKSDVSRAMLSLKAVGENPFCVSL